MKKILAVDVCDDDCREPAVHDAIRTGTRGITDVPLGPPPRYNVFHANRTLMVFPTGIAVPA